MQQGYANNHDYEILTPYGWEDFKGVIYNKNVNSPSRKIIFTTGEFIHATGDHRLYRDNKKTLVNDLRVGDALDGLTEHKIITEIQETILHDTFEIYNTTSHTVGINSIKSKQCDEFAFLAPNIAEDFWTSISPTLATGGRAIITSTPNSDEDTFANLWNESQEITDIYGKPIPGGLGRNGFSGFTARWDEHPERDEEWRRTELGRIGEERFRREYLCEFLVFEETLIDSVKLSSMRGIDPIHSADKVRWFKVPDKKFIYLVALDPCLGTGGDFAGIQVFELPSFVQVAEWRHNTMPIQGQVKLFRETIRYIHNILGEESENNLYWSCENNTVGEAALVVVADLGEDTFPGLFVSEPIRKGHVRKYRKGFNTTFGNKITACSRLKYLIEEDKMTINSKLLISELKTFIANGVTFKAKQGQHDDLVSATLLIVRMTVILAEWDASIFESMRIETQAHDDWEPPLPMFVTTNANLMIA